MDLKAKLADPGRRLLFEACIIPSPVVVQAVAAAGADIVMIDQEHAPTDPSALHAMITATQGFDCAALVRVLDHAPARVKLALDMGAEGIVFPLVRTEDEAAACVASTRYPPRGVRGWGAFVAHSRWNVPPMEYLPAFGDKTVACFLIETAEAVENIDAILAVDGVDMAFIAPFDLSTSLGISGQFDRPEFRDAVATVEAAARKAGVPLGGGPASTRQEFDALLSRGYRIVGGFDILQLKRTVGEIAGWIHGGAPSTRT